LKNEDAGGAIATTCVFLHGFHSLPVHTITSSLAEELQSDDSNQVQEPPKLRSIIFDNCRPSQIACAALASKKRGRVD
jgi:hypothetical protein